MIRNEINSINGYQWCGTHPHTEGAMMKVIYGNELQAMDLPEPPCVIEGIVPEGYTVLSAPRKIGKSWLALQMCMAVANGGTLLGRQAVKGQALYITLEETMDMSASRMRKMIGATPCSENMIYCHRCKGIEDGFIEELDEVAKGLPDLRLVVVDVLALIDGQTKKGEDVYHKDYRVGTTLKEWTKGKHLALIAVTHVSKKKSDDPYDDTMGTGGVTGSADALIAIRRKGRKTATMSVIGRSLPEIDIEMQFEQCRWVINREDFELTTLYEAVSSAAQSEQERWTASMLKNEYDLTCTAKEIGEYLVENKDLLFDNGIEVISIKNGGGSMRYKIRCRH